MEPDLSSPLRLIPSHALLKRVIARIILYTRDKTTNGRADQIDAFAHARATAEKSKFGESRLEPWRQVNGSKIGHGKIKSWNYTLGGKVNNKIACFYPLRPF